MHKHIEEGERNLSVNSQMYLIRTRRWSIPCVVIVKDNVHENNYFEYIELCSTYIYLDTLVKLLHIAWHAYVLRQVCYVQNCDDFLFQVDQRMVITKVNEHLLIRDHLKVTQASSFKEHVPHTFCVEVFVMFIHFHMF